MNEHEKSDNSIVPKRPANKAGPRSSATEPEEERELAKGNPKKQTSHRTQSRGRLSQALERIRSNVKATFARYDPRQEPCAVVPPAGI